MNSSIASFIQNRWTVTVTVGITAFCGGLGLGYVLGKRETVTIIEEEKEPSEQLQFNFDQTIEEVEEVDPRFEGLNFVPLEDLEERIRLANEEHQAMLDYQDKRPDPNEIQVDERTLKHIQNLVSQGLTPTHFDYIAGTEFAANNDDWDYEEELRHRTEKKPYVIHKDEFWADEKDYTQITVTYYAKDDILTDEDDTPIYNYQKIIGENMHFGHGSTDPRVFHVRNDSHQAEYEVLLHDGSFAEEVLGVEVESNVDDDHLKHSLRKFRSED